VRTNVFVCNCVVQGFLGAETRRRTLHTKQTIIKAYVVVVVRRFTGHAAVINARLSARVTCNTYVTNARDGRKPKSSSSNTTASLSLPERYGPNACRCNPPSCVVVVVLIVRQIVGRFISGREHKRVCGIHVFDLRFPGSETNFPESSRNRFTHRSACVATLRLRCVNLLENISVIRRPRSTVYDNTSIGGDKRANWAVNVIISVSFVRVANGGGNEEAKLNNNVSQSARRVHAVYCIT